MSASLWPNLVYYYNRIHETQWFMKHTKAGWLSSQKSTGAWYWHLIGSWQSLMLFQLMEQRDSTSKHVRQRAIIPVSFKPFKQWRFGHQKLHWTAVFYFEICPLDIPTIVNGLLDREKKACLERSSLVWQWPVVWKAWCSMCHFPSESSLECKGEGNMETASIYLSCLCYWLLSPVPTTSHKHHTILHLECNQAQVGF